MENTQIFDIEESLPALSVDIDTTIEDLHELLISAIIGDAETTAKALGTYLNLRYMLLEFKAFAKEKYSDKAKNLSQSK